jgi:hypothetical protein
VNNTISKVDDSRPSWLPKKSNPFMFVAQSDLSARMGLKNLYAFNFNTAFSEPHRTINLNIQSGHIQERNNHANTLWI